MRGSCFAVSASRGSRVRCACGGGLFFLLNFAPSPGARSVHERRFSYLLHWTADGGPIGSQRLRRTPVGKPLLANGAPVFGFTRFPTFVSSLVSNHLVFTPEPWLGSLGTVREREEHRLALPEVLWRRKEVRRRGVVWSGNLSDLRWTALLHRWRSTGSHWTSYGTVWCSINFRWCAGGGRAVQRGGALDFGPPSSPQSWSAFRSLSHGPCRCLDGPHYPVCVPSDHYMEAPYLPWQAREVLQPAAGTSDLAQKLPNAECPRGAERNLAPGRMDPFLPLAFKYTSIPCILGRRCHRGVRWRACRYDLG